MAEAEQPKQENAAAPDATAKGLREGSFKEQQGERAAPVELTGEELKAIEDEKIRAEEERMRLEREEKKRLEEEERKAEEEREIVEQARLQLIVEATQDEIQGLKLENIELQRRICSLQKKRPSPNTELFILEGQDAVYNARLRKWTEAKAEFKRLKDEYDKRIDGLRDRLQEKQSEAAARHEGMIHYFWSTARHSRDIVSLRGIPRRILQALEQQERDAVAEMQEVRIRRRQLKSQLAKLERKLELKDQLQLETGNLHLVDYEQLKMENESLNAKIHVKNEALSSLKKKTGQLVHSLTHVREKLQFLIVACKVDGEALANDDKTLHSLRIKTSRLKSSIMAIRRKKEALQKNFVSVSSPMMLDDMDYQREDIEIGETQFQALKKCYDDLCAEIEQKRTKLFALGAGSSLKEKGGGGGAAGEEAFSIEAGNQRWGIKRQLLGQMVVRDMVQQIAEQAAAKEQARHFS